MDIWENLSIGIIIVSLCLLGDYWIIQTSKAKAECKACLSLLNRSISLIDYFRDKSYITETDIDFLKGFVYRILGIIYHSNNIFFTKENNWEKIETAMRVIESIDEFKPENSSFNAQEIIDLLKHENVKYKDSGFEGLTEYLFKNYDRSYIAQEMDLVYYMWLIASTMTLRNDPSDTNCSKCEKLYLTVLIRLWHIQDKYLERKIRECRDIVKELRLQLNSLS